MHKWSLRMSHVLWYLWSTNGPTSHHLSDPPETARAISWPSPAPNKLTTRQISQSVLNHKLGKKNHQFQRINMMKNHCYPCFRNDNTWIADIYHFIVTHSWEIRWNKPLPSIVGIISPLIIDGEIGVLRAEPQSLLGHQRSQLLKQLRLGRLPGEAKSLCDNVETTETSHGSYGISTNQLL